MLQVASSLNCSDQHDGCNSMLMFVAHTGDKLFMHGELLAVVSMQHCGMYAAVTAAKGLGNVGGAIIEQIICAVELQLVPHGCSMVVLMQGLVEAALAKRHSTATRENAAIVEAWRSCSAYILTGQSAQDDGSCVPAQLAAVRGTLIAAFSNNTVRHCLNPA